MATRATGETGDPIIVEQYNLSGDTDKNPIVIEADKFEFMNGWSTEQIRKHLIRQKRSVQGKEKAASKTSLVVQSRVVQSNFNNDIIELAKKGLY